MGKGINVRVWGKTSYFAKKRKWIDVGLMSVGGVLYVLLYIPP